MMNFKDIKGEAVINLQFTCLMCGQKEAKVEGFCSEDCRKGYMEEITKWLTEERNP